MNAHPGSKLGRRQQATGALYLAGGLMMTYAMPYAGVAFATFGGMYLWLGTSLRRSARDLGPLTRAIDLFSRGDLESAANISEPLTTARAAATRRGAIALHGLIALERGDAKSAEGALSRALAIRTRRDFGDARVQITSIQAHRAMARALEGDEVGALEDAKLASVDRDCLPQTCATIALARAIVAAKRDDKKLVLEQLDLHGKMAGSVSAPIRTLTKSLARFARDTKRSVYRHPAKPDEAHPIDAWLEKKSPLASPEFPNVRVAEQRKPRRRNAMTATFIVVWLLLIMMLAAIWQILGAHRGPPADLFGPLQTFFVVLLGAAFALIASRVAIAISARQARRAIMIRALRGEASALTELDAQAAKNVPDALLVRATLAERAAQFEYAITRCDAGLAASNASVAQQTMTFDNTAPLLAAERAYCLAALGRFDEAEAALASITNPNFHGATTARFRVSFASALVRGDREAALELARTYAPSISIPLRDAFLIDMLEAKSDDDWAQIHAATAADPSLAKWTEHFMVSDKKKRVQVPDEIEEPLELSDESHAAEQ